VSRKVKSCKKTGGEYMASDLKLLHSRTRALAELIAGQNVMGLKGPLFTEVFEYLLASQKADGSWGGGEGNRWEVVETSVVLRALADLRFDLKDNWAFHYQGMNIAGGTQKAVDFIRNELETKSTTSIGEDIWDVCQALLAVRAFGLIEEARRHADSINSSWRVFYQTAGMPVGGSRWSGPAYLAAMVDVLVAYESVLAEQTQVASVLEYLNSLEAVRDGHGTGAFPAATSNRDIDRWNTSLVLRTLCGVAKSRPDLANIALICRSTNWLCKEAQKPDWQTNPQESPMFIARCLHALEMAGDYVDLVTRDSLREQVAHRNKTLQALWNINPAKRLGNLKAYTAVGEYLGALTLRVPAALAFQIGPQLADYTSDKFKPIDTPNGLRIVWLTDLHVAGEYSEAPYRMKLVKTFLGFKYIKANPLTQHFQEANLQRILTKVQQIKPHHILVTGDLTNFAKPEQFERVRALFLTTEPAIRHGGPRTNLDPEFWTILPGNHDVSDTGACGGEVRTNLGLFFSNFGDTYGQRQTKYDDTFPLVKRLKLSDGKSGVRIIGLDSTVEWPVWVVGYNARGRIDADQMTRLSKLLSNPTKNELTIVAIHHHPIVVPEMVSDFEDHFLSLEEAAGRKLVSLCSTTGVAAILHGHFHRFSLWHGMAVGGSHKLTIVGAPSGTMDIPGTSEKFMELREAALPGSAGERMGFALYCHHHKGNDNWIETYEAFIA
jgi:3',5'-cyclic AMP phosphodiesterase CpdA